MKIASKKLFSPVVSGAALSLVLALGAGYALAQTTSAVTPAAVSSVPDQQPPAAMPSVDASTSSAVPPSALPLNGNTAANRTKAMSALEDKVSDSAKNVMKQLSTIDTVNLDDLNTARQTVAKLDVLIEIEKRLADLDKLHNNDHSGEKTLAAAIPASALSLPTATSLYPPVGMPGSEPVATPSYMSKKLDVTRITGSDGHYSAMIQGKIMRVGDSLSDGSTIVSISNKEVTTKAKNGALHQLKVKGVDEVYGHTL